MSIRNQNPHVNNYMVCGHIEENRFQKCRRFYDEPVDTTDTGIYYLCEECAKDPKSLPVDMFSYVDCESTPDREYVIDENIVLYGRILTLPVGENSPEEMVRAS